jgi:hypothetical protein
MTGRRARSHDDRKTMGDGSDGRDRGGWSSSGEWPRERRPTSSSGGDEVD